MNPTIYLKWLGTAGFKLNYQKIELLLDPFLSRINGGIPNIIFDLKNFSNSSKIFISHGHFDHSFDVADLAGISRAEIYAPAKICELLLKRGIDKKRLFANEEHQKVQLEGGYVEVFPSKHMYFDFKIILNSVSTILKAKIFFKLLKLLREYPMGSNSDFLFDLGGYKIFFSGSGGGDYRNYAELKPDLYLLPFAGRSDLTDFYLKKIEILKPGKIFLHHFDNFFPGFCVPYPVEEFKENLTKRFPHITLIIPEINKEYSFN